MAFTLYSLLFGASAYLLSSYYYNAYEAKDRELAFPPDGMDLVGVLPKVDEYDFIIVGGGTAASPLMSKLSEKHTVLVIEIGGDPLPMTRVPAWYMHTNLDNNTAHIWNSVPQKHSSFGMNNGKVYLAQGKALGGSSTINGMSYNRGSPKDYDNWAKLVDDESWNYNNLLEYFKMTENFYQWDPSESDHIGFNGPIYISKNEDVFDDKANSMLEKWLKAGEELGYQVHGNPNWPQKEGFVTLGMTRRDGERWTGFDGFIKPLLDRETLTIHRYSEAKTIELDENGKAIGVRYLRHGVQQYATANKEIIVSAGALNSPLILMRSGIGPKEDLENAGIEVKVDLPVGQHFQDHPSLFFIEFELSPDYYAKTDPKEEINKFYSSRKGNLGNYLDIFGQAFLVSSVAKEEGGEDWPDIQFIAGINSTTLNEGDDRVFIYISLGRPSSSGSVRIDPENPMDGQVLWDPNYLETERDVKIITEALQIGAKVFDTKSLQSIGGKIVRENLPGCKDFTYGTDEYYACHAKDITRTIWHPSGTCKMGKADDPKMVVDTRLKVKGVPGLRVVDNSIMPMITNGNTMAVAYVIGQKAAAMILEDNP